VRALSVFALVFVATAADDATTLLNDVAKRASELKTWQAEGKETYQSNVPRADIQFHVTLERANGNPAPAKARLEYTDGPKSLIRVCDGRYQWTHLLERKQYWKEPQRNACAYPFTEWLNLGSELTSPTIVGHESLNVTGQTINCTIVQGQIAAGSRADLRTLWIDDATKLVWMYRVELATTTRSVRTFTLLSQHLDEPLKSAEVLVFRPPEGGTELSTALLDFDGPEGGRTGLLRIPGSAKIYRLGGNVLSPILIYKVEPSYTQEAKNAGIEGVVVLYLIVQPDGTTLDIRVIRSLDPGLDQKAIEAVSKWRFRPGTKDGVPVAVQASVEVNFKLH